MVVAPLVFEEMYPFSRMGLFTDAPRVVATYELKAPEGRALEPEDFGLGLAYVGERGFNARHAGPHVSGLREPPGLHGIGVIPSEQEVVKTIQGHLSSAGVAFVDVTQWAYGSAPSGNLERWRVFQRRVGPP
jgi:hypothetical protein